MNAAYVKIWGETVGAISWDQKRALATFEYLPKFKNLSWELSPLKMPLQSPQNTFSFPDLRKNRQAQYDTFKGLPGLLADVLPDRYGNQLINLWLARQGRAQDSMNPVEMLCFIGTRGMGALEFEPTTFIENTNTFSIELESMVHLAKKMLNARTAFEVNLQEEEEKAVMGILKIGTSAGGARPKAVIAYNPKTGEVKSGQTKTPQGFGHWLIKLDGVSEVQLGASNGYGRVEMAYYNMARECGIEMMPSLLLEEKDRAHFMTQRFDREGNDTKHHIQTFCAMQHYDYNLVDSFSYEQLFQTMRELKLNYTEMEQLFRRMVFNVAGRNCDDHTKNFSFRLKKSEQWTLAPAYDLCHAYRPGSEWVSQHSLSINGKRKDITAYDLLAAGQAIKPTKAQQIIAQISGVIANWQNYADEAKVAPVLRNMIASTLVKL